MAAKPINPLLAAALDYLARGWSVIPLCPPDHKGCTDEHKAGCTRHGKRPLYQWQDYQQRLPREKEVRLWWARDPNANVGVCMGPVSGLVGLDIDGPQGEVMLKELSDYDVPETLEFKTPGGGRRLLYSVPPGLVVPVRSFEAGGKEALRVLSRGSQTVMPPSVHPKGGEYEWVLECRPGEAEAVPCPQWLLTLLGAKGDDQGGGPGKPAKTPVPQQGGLSPVHSPVHSPLQRAEAYLAKCEPSVSGQGGHDRTFKIACKLVHGFGLKQDEAFRLLEERYNPRCQPPWSEKELLHKVSQAFQKGTASSLLADHPKNGHASHHQQQQQPQKSQQPQQPQPAKQNSVNVRDLTKIEARKVEWLWKDYLPEGKLVLLDGDPGLGKSTLLLDIAARVSMSGAMPDHGYGKHGGVLVLSGEDDEEDTVKPRLVAAGADESRVHCLFSVNEGGGGGGGGGERPVVLPTDLHLLEALVKELDVRLVIVDPLFAFLVESRTDIEVRKCMMHIRNFAQKTKCCVIGLRHLNKSSNPKALYRGSGHIAYGGAARCVLIVGKDPQDDDCRILAISKVNLAKEAPSLKYRLESQPSGVCKVVWMGPSNVTADQLVAMPDTDEQREAKEEAKTKLELAVQLLQHLLEDGPKPVAWCKSEAAKANLSTRTLERAASKLGLTVNIASGGSANQYLWGLSQHTN